MDAAGSEGRNLAELGVGTNERATLTGNILEDEKMLGTVHIAFGASAGIGGTVAVPVHLDALDRGRDARRRRHARARARPLRVGHDPARRRPQRVGGPRRRGARRDRRRLRARTPTCCTGPRTPTTTAPSSSSPASPGELHRALAAGAAVAAQRIDLRRHDGLHPRVGALDVAPVVFLDPPDRGAAIAEALLAADAIGARGRARVPLRRAGRRADPRRAAPRRPRRAGGARDSRPTTAPPSCIRPRARRWSPRARRSSPSTSSSRRPATLDGRARDRRRDPRGRRARACRACARSGCTCPSARRDPGLDEHRGSPHGHGDRRARRRPAPPCRGARRARRPRARGRARRLAARRRRCACPRASKPCSAR